MAQAINPTVARLQREGSTIKHKRRFSRSGSTTSLGVAFSIGGVVVADAPEQHQMALNKGDDNLDSPLSRKVAPTGLTVFSMALPALSPRPNNDDATAATTTNDTTITTSIATNDSSSDGTPSTEAEPLVTDDTTVTTSAPSTETIDESATAAAASTATIAADDTVAENKSRPVSSSSSALTKKPSVARQDSGDFGLGFDSRPTSSNGHNTVMAQSGDIDELATTSIAPDTTIPTVNDDAAIAKDVSSSSHPATTASSRQATSAVADDTKSITATTAVSSSRPVTSKKVSDDTTTVNSVSRPVTGIVSIAASSRPITAAKDAPTIAHTPAIVDTETVAPPAVVVAATAPPSSSVSSRPPTTSSPSVAIVRRASSTDSTVTTNGVGTTRVSVSVGVRGLRRADLFTPCDPLIRVQLDGVLQSYQTESAPAQSDNDFKSPLHIRLYADDPVQRNRQRIRFVVYDVTDEHAEPTDTQMVGFVQLTTAQLLGSLGPVEIPLEAPSADMPARGILRYHIDDAVIAADAQRNGGGTVETQKLTIAVTGLTNEPSGIAVVYQHRQGHWVNVGATEVAPSSNSPSFTTKVPLRWLSSQADHSLCKITLCDPAHGIAATSHDGIGDATFTIAQLIHCNADAMELCIPVMKDARPKGNAILKLKLGEYTVRPKTTASVAPTPAPASASAPVDETPAPTTEETKSDEKVERPKTSGVTEESRPKTAAAAPTDESPPPKTAPTTEPAESTPPPVERAPSSTTTATTSESTPPAERDHDEDTVSTNSADMFDGFDDDKDDHKPPATTASSKSTKPAPEAETTTAATDAPPSSSPDDNKAVDRPATAAAPVAQSTEPTEPAAAVVNESRPATTASKKASSPQSRVGTTASSRPRTGTSMAPPAGSDDISAEAVATLASELEQVADVISVGSSVSRPVTNTKRVRTPVPGADGGLVSSDDTATATSPNAVGDAAATAAPSSSRPVSSVSQLARRSSSTSRPRTPTTAVPIASSSIGATVTSEEVLSVVGSPRSARKQLGTSSGSSGNAGAAPTTAVVSTSSRVATPAAAASTVTADITERVATATKPKTAATGEERPVSTKSVKATDELPSESEPMIEEVKQSDEPQASQPASAEEVYGNDGFDDDLVSQAEGKKPTKVERQDSGDFGLGFDSRPTTKSAAIVAAAIATEPESEPVHDEPVPPPRPSTQPIHNNDDIVADEVNDVIGDDDNIIPDDEADANAAELAALIAATTTKGKSRPVTGVDEPADVIKATIAASPPSRTTTGVARRIATGGNTSRPTSRQVTSSSGRPVTTKSVTASAAGGKSRPSTNQGKAVTSSRPVTGAKSLSRPTTRGATPAATATKTPRTSRQPAAAATVETSPVAESTSERTVSFDESVHVANEPIIGVTPVGVVPSSTTKSRPHTGARSNVSNAYGADEFDAEPDDEPVTEPQQEAAASIAVVSEPVAQATVEPTEPVAVAATTTAPTTSVVEEENAFVEEAAEDAIVPPSSKPIEPEADPVIDEPIADIDSNPVAKATPIAPIVKIAPTSVSVTSPIPAKSTKNGMSITLHSETELPAILRSPSQESTQGGDDVLEEFEALEESVAAIPQPAPSPKAIAVAAAVPPIPLSSRSAEVAAAKASLSLDFNSSQTLGTPPPFNHDDLYNPDPSRPTSTVPLSPGLAASPSNHHRPTSTASNMSAHSTASSGSNGLAPLRTAKPVPISSGRNAATSPQPLSSPSQQQQQSSPNLNGTGNFSNRDKDNKENGANGSNGNVSHRTAASAPPQSSAGNRSNHGGNIVTPRTQAWHENSTPRDKVSSQATPRVATGAARPPSSITIVPTQAPVRSPPSDNKRLFTPRGNTGAAAAALDMNKQIEAATAIAAAATQANAAAAAAKHKRAQERKAEMIALRQELAAAQHENTRIVMMLATAQADAASAARAAAASAANAAALSSTAATPIMMLSSPATPVRTPNGSSSKHDSDLVISTFSPKQPGARTQTHIATVSDSGEAESESAPVESKRNPKDIQATLKRKLQAANAKIAQLELDKQNYDAQMAQTVAELRVAQTSNDTLKREVARWKKRAATASSSSGASATPSGIPVPRSSTHSAKKATATAGLSSKESSAPTTSHGMNGEDQDGADTGSSFLPAVEAKRRSRARSPAAPAGSLTLQTPNNIDVSPSRRLSGIPIPVSPTPKSAHASSANGTTTSPTAQKWERVKEGAPLNEHDARVLDQELKNLRKRFDMSRRENKKLRTELDRGALGRVLELESAVTEREKLVQQLREELKTMKMFTRKTDMANLKASIAASNAQAAAISAASPSPWGAPARAAYQATMESPAKLLQLQAELTEYKTKVKELKARNAYLERTVKAARQAVSV